MRSFTLPVQLFWEVWSPWSFSVRTLYKCKMGTEQNSKVAWQAGKKYVWSVQDSNLVPMP